MQYESLGPYSPNILGSRPLEAGDKEYVKDVLRRVIDEIEDASETRTMFEPYAKIVNFALGNRKIRRQVAENPTGENTCAT
jgi:hypothetical protein